MRTIWNKTGLFFLAIMFFSPAVVLSSGLEADAKAKKYYPAGTPTRAVQDVDEMLDDFIVKKKGKNLTPEEEEFNRKLKRRVINGTFDLQELSMLSLSPTHWPKKTLVERADFVQTLTDLLEEKALFSKEQSAAKSKTGGKYYVTYRGEKFMNKAKTRAFVRTRVMVPSENVSITLNYKLKKKGNEWKVYDIIVDEASLVDNYRYQFNSIIEKHGYPDLVRRMKKKLNELKAQRKTSDQ